MKPFITFILFLSIETVLSDGFCGPNSQFTIAGDKLTLPIAFDWAEKYTALCPNTIVNLEAVGSSSGVDLVCSPDDDAVVGMMSNEWKDTEGTIGEDGFTYSCLIGDTDRKAAEIVVANDAIVVVVQEGSPADDCQRILGGFTKDQLRWIFSDYSEIELKKTGWKSSSLANSDDDDSTHLWSELDRNCANEEIVLISPPEYSETFKLFTEAIFNDGLYGKEDLPDSAIEIEGGERNVLFILEEQPKGISYVKQPVYEISGDEVVAVPINGVEPTQESITNGDYSLLGNQIYMNIYTGASLEQTIPFLEFGLMSEGVDDYVPLSDSQVSEMMDRLDTLYRRR